MFDLIARVVNRRAWFVVAAAVLFTALSGVVGGSVSARLHQGGFVRPNSQSEAAISTLAAATGTRADRNVIALVRVDSMSSAAGRAEVEGVARTIAADPDVKAAWSFYETNDPSMVSSDGRQTLVFGLFGKDVNDDVIAAAPSAPRASSSR